jgi:hypothetical protein
MENALIPAKRALAALDKPPADVDASVPAKRISKKVRAAIAYMINGECRQISEAAAKAGLARETLSRALSQPHVAEHMRQRVVRHLAARRRQRNGDRRRRHLGLWRNSSGCTRRARSCLSAGRHNNPMSLRPTPHAYHERAA